jgi:hypothetical protein
MAHLRRNTDAQAGMPASYSGHYHDLVVVGV